MNSGTIGKIGESYFKLLCSVADITANKSNEDEAGWDYRVDMPPEDSDLSYDVRPSPFSCAVQIKSVLDTTTDIKLKLNMAERLVKYTGPSFIFCPIIRNKRAVQMKVFHLQGELIDKILKSLREKTQDGVSALHHKSISFSLSNADVLDSGGEALLDYFKSQVPNINNYVVEKRDRLSEYGFSGGKIVFTVASVDDRTDDILKAFLGVGGSIYLDEGGVFRSRYGVELKEGSLAGSSLEINPTPTGTASVLVGDAEAIEMLFDYYKLPEEMQDLGKAVSIKSDFCSFFIKFAEERIHISIEFFDCKESKTAVEWKKIYNFIIRLVQDGSADVYFGQNSQPLVLSGLSGFEPDFVEGVNSCFAASDKLGDLQSLFGEDVGCFDIASLLSECNALERFHSFCFLSAGARMRLKNIGPAGFLPGDRGLLVLHCNLLGKNFSALFEVIFHDVGDVCDLTFTDKRAFFSTENQAVFERRCDYFRSENGIELLPLIVDL